MSAQIILTVIVVYFILLVVISFFTSSKSGKDAFFTGDKASPWYLVAFGMIGASLSGITFISIPGWVESQQFAYMQMVLGYLLGYAVIAYLLMPLYYRLNITSIYTYLYNRFDKITHRTGASFFLISRILGASLRLFLVVDILQLFVFDEFGIPFWGTASISIILIWLYTFRSGIKTVVWTDTLQTFFMLFSLGLTIYFILNKLDWSLAESITHANKANLSQIFFFDNFRLSNYFPKQFLGGMFMAIAMTGLDQDMMQKNLTCKSLKDAQKNMMSFSTILIIVNLVFLFLGALLYLFLQEQSIDMPVKMGNNGPAPAPDRLFATIAINHLPQIASITFIIGLIAAAYSSADSALTSLTTSFCFDFIDIKSKPEQDQKRIRLKIHIAFSLLLLLVINLAKITNQGSVIHELFVASTYTYGPLLGLFAFGIFTKKTAQGPGLLIVCLIAPVIVYIIDKNASEWLFGYQFGYEKLLLNGLLTFIGIWLVATLQKDKRITNV